MRRRTARLGRRTVKLGRSSQAALFAVAAASLLGVACGESGSPNSEGSLGAGTSATTVVDTTGAWARVDNYGEPPQWDLVMVASIGPGRELSEPTPMDFGEVASVALGPDEDLVFVADRQSCEVRVFAIDGESPGAIHRRTFGRCGEGPGELTKFVWSIAWVGDKLLAFDMGGGRIGEFSADGEWLGQRKTMGWPGGSWQQALHPVGEGKIYAWTMTPDPPADGGRLRYAWAGHDAGGETPDSVFPPATEPPSPGLLCEQQGDGFYTVEFFNNPYAPRALMVPGPGGTLFSAMSDEYRIVVAQGGDTVRTIARPLDPEPVSDSEWDALSARFDEWLEDKPGLTCKPPRPVRPPAKPVVKAIAFDAAGHLWVEVARMAGNRWEIFDAEGKLVAQMPAPDRKEAALPALGVRHVALIRQDSLGLDHVDVWRIEARE